MTDRNLDVDPEIVAYYSKGEEEQRLWKGRGQLERVRTQEILLRYLPPAPATVLDVGGAMGAYALWLAGLGYGVHLIDVVPLHVEAARRASQRQSDHPLASVTLGDARQLPWADESVDVVLLFGPLYHLTASSDRIQALREARRVLRPGGIVLAVGISRFAPLLDGLFLGLLDDPDYVDIVDRDLKDGQHRDLPGRGYFTTAYLHLPSELVEEGRTAGLSVEQPIAIDGLGMWLADFAKWWNDPKRHDWLVATTRSLESEPSLLGASAHFMVVGRKT